MMLVLVPVLYVWLIVYRVKLMTEINNYKFQRELEKILGKYLEEIFFGK